MKRVLLLIVTAALVAALLGCAAGAEASVAEPAARMNQVQPDMMGAPSVKNNALSAAARLNNPAGGAALLGEAVTAATQSGMPDATVDGVIEGTVLAIAPNDIVINTPQGNTISLMMNYIFETNAKVGDEVKIEYSGNILDRPEAITVSVNEQMPAHTLIGTAYMRDPGILDVEISSKQTFGVLLTKNTVIDGMSDFVVDGDKVSVTYSGDLFDVPRAEFVHITDAVTNRMPAAEPQATAKPAQKTANPNNKTIDGLVKKVSSSSITIMTSRTNTYSFKINKHTRITGKYHLDVGTRVTVYYDGHASKSPDAKAINVYAPKDPSPTPTPRPDTRTASGKVTHFGGMWLELSSGIGFDVTYARYSGNSGGYEGDQARVSYYVGKDGINYATHVTFTASSPTPTPKPTPKPSTKTTSGTVVSFGGMWLSLDNGMGFDVAYSSNSGSSRLPGDKATVTYYVGSDGMNYATKIVFTPRTGPVPAPATPIPTPEPTPEPTERPTPEPTEKPTPEPTDKPEPTRAPEPDPTKAPEPDPTKKPDPPPPPPDPDPEPSSDE